MDAIKTLKKLIQQEIGADRPSFTLIRSYMDALKEALARQRKLSVSDVGDEMSKRASYDEDDEAVEGHIMVGNNVYGHARRRGVVARDSMEDNLLTAMDQMAMRAGPDPLAALLQSLPVVESLYDEGEREALRQRLRTMVDRRLGTVSEAPQLPPTTRQELLVGGNTQ